MGGFCLRGSSKGQGRGRWISRFTGIFLISSLLFFLPHLHLKPGALAAPTSGSSEASETDAAAGEKGAEFPGFCRVNGRWYYRDRRGRYQMGWIYVNDRIYYARKDGHKGSLLTGWQILDGKEYYFRSYGGAGLFGSALTDLTTVINGISCSFDRSGVFTGCSYAEKGSGFITRVGELARNNQRRFDLLASATLAQACVETGFGTSAQARIAHNLFGLRGGSFQGYMRFASEQASFDGYTSFMRQYFPRLFGVRDYRVYLNTVGKGGYAEEEGYAPVLIACVEENRLTRFSR